MIKITLYNAGGHMVRETEVPQMSPLPEIIKWGERQFIKRHETGRYVEAVTYVVF